MAAETSSRVHQKCTHSRNLRAALRLDEEKGAVMATDVITVTFLLPGRLIPREFKSEFKDGVSDETLARYAPSEGFAFRRGDKPHTTVYVDGEVVTVEELRAQGERELALSTISDGARSAVRLKGTNMWCPFFRTDRVVMTDR